MKSHESSSNWTRQAVGVWLTDTGFLAQNPRGWCPGGGSGARRSDPGPCGLPGGRTHRPDRAVEVGCHLLEGHPLVGKELPRGAAW